jgi:hypothetical protein
MFLNASTGLTKHLGQTLSSANARGRSYNPRCPRFASVLWTLTWAYRVAHSYQRF